ncbi:hypothetical protein PLICRDRAFT_165168 [Plicaturopsis crispa FD-325 SS-3]|nr:hypothetical protein PLICRDRAFT_165168 [Plicaturopsis crispa FD-325 SS-3]
MTNDTHWPPPPFYYSPAPSVIPSIPDSTLALAAPVIAYWSLSLFFHALDSSHHPWLDRHRIHPSAEVQRRNRATRSQVLAAVLFQQVVQTALGYYWVSDSASTTDWRADLSRLHASLPSYVGAKTTWWVYWWLIPLAQLGAAAVFIDSWQYFLHRAMHLSPFLYRHLHSVHHRLSVPYAFGSLYNHPLEGFLLDSLGAALAESVTGMTVRQACVLFAGSTLKTVDDHCGYRLPWDPLQWFTENCADYHDIHHQQIGIKSNFSQPFFVHWDVLLGTRMTRADVEARRAARRGKSAAPNGTPVVQNGLVEKGEEEEEIEREEQERAERIEREEERARGKEKVA